MAAKTIDEYLAGVSAKQRAALEKLRKAIRAIVPNAEECINYGVPAFRLNGKCVAGIGASANHCSYYPMSSATLEAHQSDLKSYETSKGAIRFAANKPLSMTLLRKLIKTRIAEIEVKPEQARLGKKHGDSQTNPAVIAFLDKLSHPLKKEIETIRQIILGVSPEIREGIKWNSPSFRTTEYFATMNLRAKDGKDRVWLILHLGAKAKDNSKELKIADPAGLLQWLAKDRAIVRFDDAKDAAGKRKALEEIVREWIKWV